MSFMIFFKFYTNYITYYWKNNYWQFFWNLGWHLIVKPWCYHLVSNEAVYFYKTKVNTHTSLLWDIETNLYMNVWKHLKFIQPRILFLLLASIFSISYSFLLYAQSNLASTWTPLFHWVALSEKIRLYPEFKALRCPIVLTLLLLSKPLFFLLRSLSQLLTFCLHFLPFKLFSVQHPGGFS